MKSNHFTKPYFVKRQTQESKSAVLNSVRFMYDRKCKTEYLVIHKIINEHMAAHQKY